MRGNDLLSRTLWLVPHGDQKVATPATPAANLLPSFSF